MDNDTQSVNNNPQQGAKRKQLTQACDMCRKKKIKCDGGNPCGNCLKTKKDCTYLPSTKKRGPRQGYIEMLEKRLDKMEKLLTTTSENNSTSSNGSLSTVDTMENKVTDNVQTTMMHLPQQRTSQTHGSFPHSLLHHNNNTTTNDNNNNNNSNNNINNNNNNNTNNNKDNNLMKSINDEQTSNHNFTLNQSQQSQHHQQQQSPILQRITHDRSGSMSDHTQSPSSLGSNLSIHNPIPTESLLPPKPIVDHLIQLFFEKIYPSYPLFDPRIFMKEYREGKHSEFLLLSILAVSSRFSDNPNVKEEPPWNSGEKYAVKARPFLLAAIDEPNIPNVQAIALLSLHEFGSARGPRSWMYTGLAIRMAMELGLNKEPDIEQSFEQQNQSAEKWTEQETKRRVFWVIFITDKLSSAATGRSSSIPIEDCEVLLPCDEYGWVRGQFYTETLDGSRVAHFNVGELRDSSLLSVSGFVGPSPRVLPSTSSPPSSASASSIKPPGVLSCFSYLLRAAALLGRVSTFVNRTARERVLPPFDPDSDFAKLDKNIDEWYDELPPMMKYTQDNVDRYCHSHSVDSNRFFLAHIMHNTLIVLLHRPSLVIFETLNSDVVQPALKEFCKKSVEKCLRAVDNVNGMLKVISFNLDLLPSFISYLSYTVATIVVNNTISSNPEIAKKAKEDLNVHFHLLEVMRRYWAMADKLFFMIKDLYGMHTNAIRHSSLASTSSKSESMSPASSSSPIITSMAKWNNNNNNNNSSNLLSPITSLNPPQRSPTINKNGMENNNYFPPTNSTYTNNNSSNNNNSNNNNNNNNNDNSNDNNSNNSLTMSQDILRRKMSLAELALTTCDGASVTNWTIGDNRENIAAALQCLKGRSGGMNGSSMPQPMFDINTSSSTASSTTATTANNYSVVDNLAYNLGFSTNQFNNSTAP
ncbi:unnamed protein product [Cunninghamella blakesleeana]